MKNSTFSYVLFIVLLSCLCVGIFGMFFTKSFDGEPVLPTYDTIWSEVSLSASVISSEGVHFFDTLTDFNVLIDDINHRIDRHTYNPLIEDPLGNFWDVDGEMFEKNIFNGIYLFFKYIADLFVETFFILRDIPGLLIYIIKIPLLIISTFVFTIIEIFSLPFRIFGIL